jgi:hypothetical protein
MTKNISNKILLSLRQKYLILIGSNAINLGHVPRYYFYLFNKNAAMLSPYCQNLVSN